jgi:hypothetical protein
MASKKSALTWNEKGETLLRDYLKKSKSSGGAIAVLSRYGEVLWKEGKWKSTDWTSLGSLVTALKATSDGIAGSLRVKAKTIAIGDSANGCWMYSANGQWNIVGVKIQLKDSLLKDILQLLKSAKGMGSESNLSQELAGLSPEGIESVLRKGL